MIFVGRNIVRSTWLCFFFSSSFLWGQVPAFPGADGFGAAASGGRAGAVYHVANLDNDGPGSLRYGIETANSPLTIVFDISGNIELTNYLRIRTPNMTIAGQTAPGTGVCIQNYGMIVQADNVILRHLRIRPGDKYLAPADQGGFTEDALSLSASMIIADHISASWGVDENLSCGTKFQNITIQNCIIAEGLHKTLYYHGVYTPDHSGHSMGSLVKIRGQDAVATLHHNLWAHNSNRNPAIGSYDSTEYLQVDVRNNVMYNCATFGYSSGASKKIDLNYVGNYLIAGRSTPSGNRSKAFEANPPNHLYIYQSGNKIDPDLDNLRDGKDTGWLMFTDTWSKQDTAFLMPIMNTQSADDAYMEIIADAGAFPWARDSVDIRIINDLQQGTGRIIDSQAEVGGYPQLPVVQRPSDWDTDQDGMPDQWEDSNGLNKTDPEDRNGDDDGDGYTNLEAYLNSTDLLVSVKETAVIIPENLALNNFPNPFNPSTSIVYTLPEKTPVHLSVYSSTGAKICDLVNKTMPGGNYQVEFSGENLASGVYFIHLQTGEQSATRKMILIK